MSKYTGKKWNIVNTSKTNVETYNNEGRAIYNNKSKADLQNALENRRAFVPNINQLKSKIEDTGDNHPKQAIVLMGHCDEGWKPRVPIKKDDDDETIKKKWEDIIPDMIKVPKGSIVVIKSHPGDATLDLDVMINCIYCLSKENEYIILDPIKYIDNITNQVGSVSIFREGDMCPNLTHATMDIFNRDKYIELGPSGIINIPNSFNYTIDKLIKYITTKIKIPKSLTVKEYKDDQKKLWPSISPGIEYFFKYNDFLNKNQMLDDFQYLLQNENTQDKKIVDIITDLASAYYSKFQQKALFKLKPNTITYAFNCRTIDNHEHFVSEIVRLGVKSKNNLKGIVTYHVPTKIRQEREETNVSTKLNRKNLRNTTYKSNSNSNNNITRKNNATINQLTQPNNLNIVKNRSRVKNMAGEIKQEIKESIDQRRLGALSIAKKSKNKYTSNYINSVHFNTSSDITNISTEYAKLYKLKDETPNLKEKIDTKLKELSKIIYKSHSNIINTLIKSGQSDEEKIKSLTSELHIDLQKYPELYDYLKRKVAKSDSFFSRFFSF